MPAKLTNEKFIEKCIKIHGDRYDYSKVEYNGANNYVTIICKEHGEFQQKPTIHLDRSGCQLCDTTKRLSTEEFIKRSKVLHGDKYDYSKVVYGKNNYETVEIICLEHGIFSQRPWGHLKGQGCPNCANNTLETTDEFINKSILLHGDRYDYSLTKYIGRRKNITIICNKHGVFEQEARVHLMGHGCKKCKSSKLEDYLLRKLQAINELFEINKRYDSCRNKYPLPFDFYLPLRNILVECDGIQHKESIEYFGGDERLEYQQNNDNIKTKWSLDKSIKLYRLTSIDEIDDFVDMLSKTELVFDKSILKDLSLDRSDKIKNDINYLVKTDFNYYAKNILLKDFGKFIDSLNVDYKKNFTIDNSTIDYLIGNIGILLIDNFRDCEINKNKNWIVQLKDKLELSNINLIVIYPEQLINKNEIVKSRIRNILGINVIKIGARKCEIKILTDNKVIGEFLDNNHIQGKINAGIKIGLIHNGEIVSIMTFGKLRKNLGQTAKENSYELLRFCNKLNYSIVGSANKLLNYFKLNYSPEYILSYADRCWTSINKNVYITLGMDLVSKTQPSYSYLIGDNKFDRFRYRKDILIQFGYQNDKWTERSICSSNHIFRIYDSGCLKYEYIK